MSSVGQDMLDEHWLEEYHRELDLVIAAALERWAAAKGGGK